MGPAEEITALIPHREPFLWVDRIISATTEEIITEKAFDPDLAVFQGHYPDNPIMPGVLLCEAVFQSSALLMAGRGGPDGWSEPAHPVITRIKNAKFKRSVLPGDVARINVRLVEVVSSAHYFKGTLKVGGNTAVQVEFVCAMVAQEGR
jgi:3-hydroxyacyl-[acyl-carrier-protein] dehydratase